MLYFLKSSFRVLVDYLIALLIFAIFIYVFISISGDSFNNLLPIYCFITFVLAFFVIYGDMKALAQKETKPQYGLKAYPIKGLLYGLAGFSPVILLEILSVIIKFNTDAAERIKHVFINIIMGPNYFLIRLMGESAYGYAAASLLVPIVAMIGYLAGFYGFEFNKKKKMKLAEQQAAFKKSPWNPSNNTQGKAKDSKKKKPTH